MAELAGQIDVPSQQLLIDEVISKLQHFVRLYGVNSLFIAGGYCRSLYLNRPWDINDIDVASAYSDQAIQLGGLFASEVLKTVPKFYKRTGTAAIEYSSEFGSIKIEFQGKSPVGYMNNEEVRNWMHAQQIDDEPLMNNIYGRDFTINSLIYSLHSDRLYDPTGRAEKHFDRKLICSLLPAEMLIKYNPLAILRAIRFALKYDFYIDVRLRMAMKSGRDLLQESLSEERILKEIVRILKTDATKGLEMLKKFELDPLLLHPDIKNYISLEAIDDDEV